MYDPNAANLRRFLAFRRRDSLSRQKKAVDDLILTRQAAASTKRLS